MALRSKLQTKNHPSIVQNKPNLGPCTMFGQILRDYSRSSMEAGDMLGPGGGVDVRAPASLCPVRTCPDLFSLPLERLVGTSENQVLRRARARVSATRSGCPGWLKRHLRSNALLVGLALASCNMACLVRT